MNLAQIYGETANFADRKEAILLWRDGRVDGDDTDERYLLLQKISTSLIREDDIDALFERILDGAISLVNADFGSIQMFHAERNELSLLAWRGFHPASAEFWDRVGAGSLHCSCGVAFKSGERTIVADAENCEFMAGSDDLDHYRLSGIQSVQSTPLVSRSGELLGMISTHWRDPYDPPESSLRLLDVLARQAADLIERARNEAKILMLGQEAEHRAKNVFATVRAIVQLSQADEPEALKQAILGRINALRSAHHMFVESRWTGADLRRLASEELSPYCEGDRRAELIGPDLVLQPDAAQSIAVVLHKLATNSAKYGALSVAGGHVRLSWSKEQSEALVIQWAETNGPAARAPSREGKGTRVMRKIITSLGGKVGFDWLQSGLVCKIAIPA